MQTNVIQTIAGLIDTLRRNEWEHAPSAEALGYIMANFLPSGSGIDSGCVIDPDKQKANRVVISCQFHHMNENGYYDGWTSHDITVTPAFGHRPDIRVTGRDRNGIKEYLADIFANALDRQIEKRWNVKSKSWEIDLP